MKNRYEAVVIGSGFGGAINACRLSKRWPGDVLVLERGRRYGLGGFPRTPHDVARNFWNIESERRQRPAAVESVRNRGLFDVRNFDSMDVVLGAGLGGGSLIYANVFLEPPDVVFSERWPRSCAKSALLPYYDVARQVLGARPIPDMNDDAHLIRRTRLFQKVAGQLGRKSQLLDINVFFGNDFSDPLPRGVQDKNRYGAIQTSCVYCAECDVGCNYHAKNTLDLNYLFRAERQYGADVLTEHIADWIVPVDSSGKDDPAADGSSGYRVNFRDLSGAPQNHSVLTNRIVVSAGTLGSTEFLLRCRDVFGSLRRVNGQLGRHFSGNGDFLSFIVGGDQPVDPNSGPVITQGTDCNLFENYDSRRAFILQDAGYPNFAAWFAEGAKPGFLRLKSLRRLIRHFIGRLGGSSAGSVAYAFEDILRGDISYNTCVLLCMGIDASNGIMKLDREGWLDLEWPQQDSRSLYDAILEVTKDFSRKVNGEASFALPTWWWPLRKNVTVHPLGGCVLGDGPLDGVTSASPETFGQVFGYSGLYVADGSIVPTAVGANPSATICALAERVAQGITGIAPTAEL